MEPQYDPYESPLSQHQTARLIWNKEDITAYYLNGEAIMDELTVITQESDVVDGYVIPEETDLWTERCDAYYNALCAWVSGITGVEEATLREAYHPDLGEPWIRYQYPVPQA